LHDKFIINGILGREKGNVQKEEHQQGLGLSHVQNSNHTYFLQVKSHKNMISALEFMVRIIQAVKEFGFFHFLKIKVLLFSWELLL